MSVKVMKERTTGLKQKAHKAPINFAETVESFIEAAWFRMTMELVKSGFYDINEVEKTAIETTLPYFDDAISRAVATSEAIGVSLIDRIKSIRRQCITRVESVADATDTCNAAALIVLNSMGPICGDKTARMKETDLPESIKTAFRDYINSIKGQVKGMAGMLESGAYSFKGENIHIDSGILYALHVSNVEILVIEIEVRVMVHIAVLVSLAADSQRLGDVIGSNDPVAIGTVAHLKGLSSNRDFLIILTDGNTG